MGRALCLAAAVLVAALCTTAGADIPMTVSYQGVLRDNDGDPVPDGTYAIVFRIYDTPEGGTALWGEEQDVPVAGGIMNAHLGSFVPLTALDFTVPCWLGIQIGGSPELTPRIAFETVPYAAHAAFADSLVGGGWKVDGDNVYHEVGNVGVGTPTPDAPLEVEASSPSTPAAHFVGGTGIAVDAAVTAGGFQMPTGAGAGMVLTSDDSGVGTWQAATGTDADWIISGGNMYSGVSGRVGIGDSTPDGKLGIYTGIALEALAVEHAGVNVGRVVSIERTSTPASGNDILQLAVPAGSPDDFQFAEFERGGETRFAVNGDGSVEAERGTFSGAVSATSTTNRAGNFIANGSVPSHGVHVECNGTGLDSFGVHATCVPADGHGHGGQFQGGWVGVRGWVQPTGSDDYIGVVGVATGGTGYNYGVKGTANFGTYAYGVYGEAGLAPTNYAGYFSGNVRVTGTLTAGAKQFTIDHPLDPTGTYLQHACVESDEMANMYTGNVVLDARGEATVTLPDWFEALNRDFRYQLTCVGGFAPVYVAKKVSGNAFQIAGGEPGMEVSWMVTGVRHDPYARAHGLEVEVAKPADERGKYMHPDAYGMPETAGVDYRPNEQRPPPVSESAAPQAMPVHDPNDGE